jgi:putative FmdB family regulatory protein
MPTYTYQCKKCNHSFDMFHAMSAQPRVKCTRCGAGCRRMIGTGAGIIFKGSGFYQTDYKNQSTDYKSKTGDSKAAPASESKKTETETKSDSAKSSSTTKKGSD